MKKVVLVLLTTLLLPACVGGPVDDNKNCQLMMDRETCIEDVVYILKDKDIAKLATLVHPNSGLRFSPYGYVNASDLVFSSEEMVDLVSDSGLYTWGTYDGRGNPIELSFADYYDRFVYSNDFVSAPERSVNERLGQGNTIDNTSDFYPEAEIYEYYFPGFDEQYEGMDWRSLRLVFLKFVDSWTLAGIIHDEWTI